MINLHLLRTRSPWRLWPSHCPLRDKVNDGIVRGRRWANRSTLMVILEDKAHLIWGRRPPGVLRCCWRADRCSGGDSESLRGDSPGPRQHWKRAQRVKKDTRWGMYFIWKTPYSSSVSFTVAGAVTFYRAPAAGSPSPVLHRCWPAVSGTWGRLPDCTKREKGNHSLTLSFIHSFIHLF